MYLAIDEMLHSQQPRSLVMERRWKSNVEIAPNCPRCASLNTKFCYYNNYSLSQPRYFCKDCRRYWTKGGSLRNVPTGRGCRKSRNTKAVCRPSSGGSSDDGSPGIERDISDPSIVGPPGAPTIEPDIDMAAVFAKFVNRTEEANSSSDIIGSQNQDVSIEGIFVDIQTQSCTSKDREQNFTEFPNSDHILQEGQAHDFSGHDPNFFGLQTILTDELVQEPMWSDTTISTNFSLRSMEQLQEFGSYCDDQSKFSTHFGENWSLFDLPTYDII